jgi:hypothetical protein
MFETFMSQWIWLIIFIFALYYKLVTDLIPKISNSFKARRNLESGDVVHAASAQAADLNLDLTSPATKSLNSSAYSSVFTKNFTAWSTTA